MAERIIARLINQQDACVQWLLVNDATPSETQQGTLQDLANSAKNKPVTLILPASDVLLLALDLPVKTASQIKKALPFALDDLLADDVETYHLVWHRHPKDKVYVAAISHDKFQACLLPFQDVGIELDSVYPETLCLPYQDQSCSILIDRHNAILRSGQWLGGGIDVEVLPAFVDKLLEENPHLQSLQVWDAGVSKQWLFGLPIIKVEHELDSPLQLLQAGAVKLGGELNLLSGQYSRKNKADWQWKKWSPALGVILLAALIQTGGFLNGYWKQKSELASLETQTLALFKQTFPDVKRVVNIKVQADQQLTELKKQSSENGSRFMRLLYQSGEVLSANPGFQLRQLDFANDILQLQLTAPDISQIEQFKQQLESSNELSIKVQSAEAGQNTVEAHLEIREK
ncbi:type II secretion system protein GspL [Methylobacter sp.]|uniref:type II secretion system protein GspL n=1 Tax=Methylobacter sp. TaxID=2051955 RepID=UPI0025FA6B04|nr:type II secretion system protein GspL [Methylobacter sp.]